MKIKTADLTRYALDWAVATCEEGEAISKEWHPHFASYGGELRLRATPYSPSTDWNQGGPIIEREKIEVTPPTPKWCDEQADNDWMAVSLPAVRGEATLEVGPTPLIAAMRCYVASKLGDEVEIPEELT
jgi:hypothetical protein